MTSRTPLALLAVLLTTVSATKAQEAATLARWRAVLAGSHTGALLRLHARTGARFEGRLVRFDSTVVELGGTPAVPLAQIDEIWKRGSAWKRYAAIGGLVAAFIPGIPFAVLSGMCEGSQCHTPQHYILVSAVIGVVLGAALGAQVPEWHPARPHIPLW
jgi:hypothetical protein